jgi:hypothetical protein
MSTQFVKKSGHLDKKAISQYLTEHYGTGMVFFLIYPFFLSLLISFSEKWPLIPTDFSSVQQLIEIDNIRTKVMSFGVGLVLRRAGQMTRLDLFGNGKPTTTSKFTRCQLRLTMMTTTISCQKLCASREVVMSRKVTAVLSLMWMTGKRRKVNQIALNITAVSVLVLG